MMHVLLLVQIAINAIKQQVSLSMQDWRKEKIIASNKVSKIVTLSGSIIDKILGLPALLVTLYKEDPISTTMLLLEIIRTRDFKLDNLGQVIGFQPTIWSMIFWYDN